MRKKTVFKIAFTRGELLELMGAVNPRYADLKDDMKSAKDNKRIERIKECIARLDSIDNKITDQLCPDAKKV